MSKQPEPIKLEIPIMNNAVMYSMIDEFNLIRLRTFIDELIKWKAAGNTTVIETKFYAIITEKDQNHDKPNG